MEKIICIIHKRSVNFLKVFPVNKSFLLCFWGFFDENWRFLVNFVNILVRNLPYLVLKTWKNHKILLHFTFWIKIHEELCLQKSSKQRLSFRKVYLLIHATYCEFAWALSQLLPKFWVKSLIFVDFWFHQSTTRF